MSFNDVTIVSVTGNDYRIHVCYMSKNEAIKLLKKTLKKVEYYKIKMNKKILTMLKWIKKYNVW